MKKQPRPQGYWTFERCKERCKDFNRLQRIVEQEPGIIHAFHRHPEWKEECLSHIHIASPHPKPTLDEAAKIAKLYERKVDFQKSKEHGHVYRWAYSNGYLDQICTHMQPTRNLHSRCIYVATFPDGYAYVGLTDNHERRWKCHLQDKKSPVRRHSVSTGSLPMFNIIHDYVVWQEAKKKEGEYITKYSSDGWKLLNTKMKGGELGCPGNGYSKEEVFMEAKKYSTPIDFLRNAAGYYIHGYRSDYWDEVLDLFDKHAVRTKWTQSEIDASVNQCKSFAEWRSRFKRIYEYCYKHPELLKKVKEVLPARNIHRWSDDEILEAALQCKTRSEFQARFPNQFFAAYHRPQGLDFFCQHMLPKYEGLRHPKTK